MIKEMNSSVASKIAEHLLEIGAVKLNPSNPFEWASGWKSPIYCDNRLSLSFPSIRTYITDELVKSIKTHFPDVECIAGVATAGVPQGALIAAALDLPFVYVRSKPKDHGMTNLIEGKIQPGQKTVVIEDLISTGGSSLKAAFGLKDAGFKVLGMAAIFTYGFEQAKINFNNAGIPLSCLCDYEALVQVALQSGYIKQSDMESLQQWRLQPEVWGK